MDTITLYVDGACPSNGKPGASMFWSMGVWHDNKRVPEYVYADTKFANPHKFMPTERELDVCDHRHTNQVAELYAIQTALQYINGMTLRYEKTERKINEHVQFSIRSDSEYAIGAASNNKVKANHNIVTVIRSMLHDLRYMYGDEFIIIEHIDREHIVSKLGH